MIVLSDHGFSTISKESGTSSTAQNKSDKTPGRPLPYGFLALDLARALDLPLNDPDMANRQRPGAAHQKRQRANRRRSTPIPKSSWPPMAAPTWSTCRRPTRRCRETDRGRAADPGLYERNVRRFKAWQISGTLSFVDDRARRRGHDADPAIAIRFRSFDRVRRADELQRRSGRHGSAAGPGHARHLLPRRHAEQHGDPGAEL